MSRFILVELDTGEQEFFDDTYSAFKYAKENEDKRRHSVEYVAIGEFYETEGIIYKGNQLRHLLRTLDEKSWIRAGFRVKDEQGRLD
jgi:hypothetical protein